MPDMELQRLPNEMPAAALAALLFDLDGTLADTDPFHFQAWQESLQSLGLQIDQGFYKVRISGRLNPAIMKDLLPQLSVTQQAQFIEHKEARFRQLAPQLQPLPGLHDVIAWATEQKLKQAVVTNAPRENADFMLRSLQLSTTFDDLVVADDLGIGKPDPAPYQQALNRFNLAPEQALAFEDSPSGVRSAVAAGIPTVGIASTQAPEVLYGVGAMLVIADFTDARLWARLQAVAS